MDTGKEHKVLKLLSMLADGYFTEGESRSRAEAQALIYMRQPGFTDSLIASNPQEKPETILLKFRDLLNLAGLKRFHENQMQHLNSDDVGDQSLLGDSHARQVQAFGLDMVEEEAMCDLSDPSSSAPRSSAVLSAAQSEQV